MQGNNLASFLSLASAAFLKQAAEARVSFRLKLNGNLGEIRFQTEMNE